MSIKNLFCINIVNLDDLKYKNKNINYKYNFIPFSQLMLKIGYPDIGQVICNC